MGWSIGYDDHWKRDIGYGVPAYCDHPGCAEEIDRGLSYVCANEEPYGGDGCGRYYCTKHRGHGECQHPHDGYKSPEHPAWITHILTDESWQKWRDENTDLVIAMKMSLGEAP